MNNFSQQKLPVSVLVPVKNEVANLERCLSHLQWADEIFVVDSQSTDGTGEKAEQMGAKLVQFHFNGTYPKKKNWSLENLPFRNEWVLIVDADEVIPPQLQREIADTLAAPEVDGYYLHFRYMFLNRSAGGKPVGPPQQHVQRHKSECMVQLVRGHERTGRTPCRVAER